MPILTQDSPFKEKKKDERNIYKYEFCINSFPNQPDFSLKKNNRVGNSFILLKEL